MPADTDQPTLAVQAHEWRKREVQAIGAAISTRSWHEVEQAYNSLRDKMDRAGCWHTPNTRTTHEPRPAGDLREALEALERACDDLAANRSRETYHNMVHCDRATPYLNVLYDARHRARELLRAPVEHPASCPVCNGDCGSANPPVMFCPMRDKSVTAPDPDPTSLEGGEDVDALAVEYAGEYVMSTEGSDYEPTQWERALILDALHGFIADHRLAAIPSTQGV